MSLSIDTKEYKGSISIPRHISTSPYNAMGESPPTSSYISVSSPLSNQIPTSPPEMLSPGYHSPVSLDRPSTKPKPGSQFMYVPKFDDALQKYFRSAQSPNRNKSQKICTSIETCKDNDILTLDDSPCEMFPNTLEMRGNHREKKNGMNPTKPIHAKTKLENIMQVWRDISDIPQDVHLRSDLRPTPSDDELIKFVSIKKLQNLNKNSNKSKVLSYAKRSDSHHSFSDDSACAPANATASETASPVVIPRPSSPNHFTESRDVQASALAVGRRLRRYKLGLSPVKKVSYLQQDLDKLSAAAADSPSETISLNLQSPDLRGDKRAAVTRSPMNEEEEGSHLNTTGSDPVTIASRIEQTDDDGGTSAVEGGVGVAMDSVIVPSLSIKESGMKTQSQSPIHDTDHDHDTPSSSGRGGLSQGYQHILSQYLLDTKPKTATNKTTTNATSAGTGTGTGTEGEIMKQPLQLEPTVSKTGTQQVRAMNHHPSSIHDADKHSHSHVHSRDNSMSRPSGSGGGGGESSRIRINSEQSRSKIMSMVRMAPENKVHTETGLGVPSDTTTTDLLLSESTSSGKEKASSVEHIMLLLPKVSLGNDGDVDFNADADDESNSYSPYTDYLDSPSLSNMLDFDSTLQDERHRDVISQLLHEMVAIVEETEEVAAGMLKLKLPLPSVTEVGVGVTKDGEDMMGNALFNEDTLAKVEVSSPPSPSLESGSHTSAAVAEASAVSAVHMIILSEQDDKTSIVPPSEVTKSDDNNNNNNNINSVIVSDNELVPSESSSVPALNKEGYKEDGKEPLIDPSDGATAMVGMDDSRQSTSRPSVEHNQDHYHDDGTNSNDDYDDAFPSVSNPPPTVSGPNTALRYVVIFYSYDTFTCTMTYVTTASADIRFIMSCHHSAFFGDLGLGAVDLHCTVCCRQASLWCSGCELAYCPRCWGKVTHHGFLGTPELMKSAESLEPPSNAVSQESKSPNGPAFFLGAKGEILAGALFEKHKERNNKYILDFPIKKLAPRKPIQDGSAFYETAKPLDPSMGLIEHTMSYDSSQMRTVYLEPLSLVDRARHLEEFSSLARSRAKAGKSTSKAAFEKGRRISTVTLESLTAHKKPTKSSTNRTSRVKAYLPAGWNDAEPERVVSVHKGVMVYNKTDRPKEIIKKSKLKRNSDLSFSSFDDESTTRPSASAPAPASNGMKFAQMNVIKALQISTFQEVRSRTRQPPLGELTESPIKINQPELTTEEPRWKRSYIGQPEQGTVRSVANAVKQPTRHAKKRDNRQLLEIR
eukprot:gene7829-16010_t